VIVCKGGRGGALCVHVCMCVRGWVYVSIFTYVCVFVCVCARALGVEVEKGGSGDRGRMFV